MQIIRQSHKILSPLNVAPAEIFKLIEQAGRICYKSEEKITAESGKKLVTNIIDSGHHSVIEHFNITVKFITDRGVTYELVRHRLASYSQESTRYCNYSKDKFGNEITVIIPVWFEVLCFPAKDEMGLTEDEVLHKLETYITPEMHSQFEEWKGGCELSESSYFKLLKLGQSPQQARTVLNNSLKTEIIVTTNLREWRHILKLRTSPKAHPQIRALMVGLLDEFKALMPVIFDNLLV